jgi:erythronate-4-phosphate dehydrogenase
VTRVDESLLAGSPVRFVGTATIGTDHVDTAYLERAGIGFSAAPGCNAVSVAEYVIAALFELAGRKNFRLREKSIGIIGVGNVGSRVESRAEALGMEVILNDPPLREATGEPKYRDLDQALESDIVTLHVPLEKGTAYPTYHMVDRKFVGRLKPGAILINTSRGAVVDSNALAGGVDSGLIGAAVLDVWEGEPDISLELLEKAEIATPHIAGYSYDGKVRGTRMIYEAACRYFGREPVWDAETLLPAPDRERLKLDGKLSLAEEFLHEAVARGYDIMGDDRALRKITEIAAEQRGAYFDRLRKEYPVRREWASSVVELSGELVELKAVFEGLGFRVETAV